jgi:SNF family Na+-dependent transporter
LERNDHLLKSNFLAYSFYVLTALIVSAGIKDGIGRMVKILNAYAWIS